MSLFSKPDERTRQLRERAGAMAMNILFVTAGICGGILALGYDDMMNGGYILGWLCAGFFFLTYFQGKYRVSYEYIRDEFIRDKSARKRGLKQLIWFTIYISIFTTLFNVYVTNHGERNTASDLITRTVSMAIFMGGTFWLLYFRKSRVKDKNNGAS